MKGPHLLSGFRSGILSKEGNNDEEMVIRFLLMCMLLALAGCGSNKREETGGCKIWYMNQAETKLEAENKELQADTTDGQTEN